VPTGGKRSPLRSVLFSDGQRTGHCLVTSAARSAGPWRHGRKTSAGRPNSCAMPVGSPASRRPSRRTSARAARAPWKADRASWTVRIHGGRTRVPGAALTRSCLKLYPANFRKE